ncbi:MAG: ABC transporter ATP-binding protein [Candidatus Nomurabacteria bacterium]|jgi:putative ABC transport system ATP-binding protein|nr:ABC transporter ATP-binding protein [Candidatus Nomurabacteria bacterium]
MSKLEVKNLKHTYSDGQRDVHVLKGVNATFESGKMYAIVGESGSGKTTLISLIAALDKVQDGDIKFDGKSIHEIGESQFRLKYVNIVFQAFNLIKYMTARENVEVALDFSGHGKDEKTRAYELLEHVGINRDKADRLVQKLSGGEQQRVAIARSMAGDVPIIVADEPTGNLDEKTEGKILTLFKELADKGKIVIVVTHSQKVAKHANATVYHMKNGTLIKR